MYSSVFNSEFTSVVTDLMYVPICIVKSLYNPFDVMLCYLYVMYAFHVTSHLNMSLCVMLLFLHILIVLVAQTFHSYIQTHTYTSLNCFTPHIHLWRSKLSFVCHICQTPCLCNNYNTNTVCYPFKNITNKL